MSQNVLKNFTTSVDGRGYAGMATELVLPKLDIVTEDIRAAGMDSSESVDMGMEPLEAEITLSGYDVPLLKLWGVTGSSVPLTARGALQSDDGTVKAAVVNLQGKFVGLDLGTWKPKDLSPKKMKMKVSYYKLTIDGEELIEIDIANLIRKVGGVDQLAEIRAALGL
ncbi:phage major tail tube protein [Thiomicrorhabdus cannonii]|uniref:phage major tail tube protein n=1 Tax=Thiomicrorhabdus cannonii TaxID=2748011 RepID=UPI0015C05D24|nr:phage major tail tube protein [Thiomicrorhabdus cannonii]